MNRNGPRAPTAIHCPFRSKFHLPEKANAIADCSEKQFTPHGLCDDNHEHRVQALLEAAKKKNPRKIRARDFVKLIQSLKLTKAC
jgi:hypothetical protein